MAKGERPNEYGYLVLDYDELRALYNLEGKKVSRFYLAEWNEEDRERILCAIINKRGIKPLQKSDVERALKKLRIRAEAKEKEYRGKEFDNPRDAKIGRQYAYYCKLFFNAKHALEDLFPDKGTRDGIK